MILGMVAIFIVSLIIAIAITKDLDNIHNKGAADRRSVADAYITSLKVRTNQKKNVTKSVLDSQEDN